MQQSELIKLIRIFDNTEMRQAEQYIKSPFHNSNQSLLKLFQYIRRFHPELSSSKLKKERVHAHLFPKEAFNDKKLRTLRSKLKKLLEQFIVDRQLKKEEGFRQKLLIKYYSDKGDYEHFSKLVQNRLDHLTKGSIRDAEYFQEMLWLQEEQYYHPNKTKYPTDEDSLLKLTQYLDQFFALSKFRFDTDLNVRKEVVNEDIVDPIPIDLLMEYFESLSSLNPLIDLYVKLFHFQANRAKNQNFPTYIGLLKTRLNLMGEKEKSFMMSCWINTAISYYNKGQQDILPAIVGLYQLADAENLILYRDKLQASSFLNLVILCSKAGEFDWTKGCIEAYQAFLSEEEKEYTLNLAWGYWYYFRSQHSKQKNDFLKKAHTHLSKINYSGLIIDLRLRSLQLRVYYELELRQGNENVFMHFADAFEKWLLRKTTLAEGKSLAYLHFVRLTKQLAKSYNNGDIQKENLLKLKQKIASQQPIILKAWLEEKVEELLSFPHPGC